MADDESRMVFWGSPDGADSVEITWIIPGGAALGRDKRVPRGEATHASVREWGGPNPGARRLTMLEANDLIGQLERHQTEKAAERKAWTDTLCSVCPHCQSPRAYAGLEQLQEGSWGRIALLGEMWGMSNVDVQVYQCLYCGSIELFRAGGPIEHPLPGNRADPQLP